MTLKDWVNSSILIKVAIVLWIVCACLIVFLLGQIDTIVNKVLYNYGLQFSYNWAIPYWSLLHLIFALLAIPSFLGGALLVLSIWKRNGSEKHPVRREQKPTNAKLQTVAENQLFVTCPNCKKVFCRPLTMLDFSQGKTKLVNVCPYCNQILDRGEEDKNSTEVIVPDVHAEEVTN